MARWEVSLNHSPKTSAGRQRGAKFWQAGDPERGVAKDKTSSASSFCWYWPDRKQGLQAPLSRQALPCLQLRMPCPIGWFYA